jgi:two-component system OmpR family sensor kinase/two-component system sensor histidine kinase BaeS
MTLSLAPASDLHTGNIRRRLFLLLGRAFAMVVVLTLVLLLTLAALVLANASRLTRTFKPAFAYALETYYFVQGSWVGVENLTHKTQNAGENDWEQGLLLDATGHIVMDNGRADTPRIGQSLPLSAQALTIPLTVNNVEVGTFVVTQPFDVGLLRLFIGLLPPLVFVSFFTGLLTLLIGLLLMRRVVTPLADVIAAAHSVAGGDLSTRVQVRGPGDLRGLTDSFNHMAETLERDDHERRNLLADIAHELRTPLTVMRGKLEGIVDGVYPADEAHVAPVLEETYILERLVEDLRLLTLAEARQLHFDRRPLDLSELARRAADLFQAEADEKSIALTVGAEAGLPLVVADPQRVGQVISNLIGNALRYVPANGRVEIAVRSSAQAVELAISDTGPGVPEADLPKLFDRFWRSEKSRSRAEGGAGLGLAIARQLIEAQGGTVSASNLHGGGLRVAFRLPSSTNEEQRQARLPAASIEKR